MVADRVPEGEEAIDKILVLNASGEHRVPSARRYHQTAAGASNAIIAELKQEVGLGHWRGQRLARLRPSRNAVHRGLWIPDLRAGDDPPQERVPPSWLKEIGNFRSLLAGGVTAIAACNGIVPTGCHHSAEIAALLSWQCCRAALAASRQSRLRVDVRNSDTARSNRRCGWTGRTSAEWLGSVWTHGVISLPSIDALQNVHSITSSAVARSGNAVLRLITSSNLVRTGDVGQLIAL